MDSKPILDLFKENEMNISALYSLYAQNIPEKSAFWEKLSNEEIAHAIQLGREQKGDGEVVENKFSRGVIRHVMDFVLEETEKARKTEVTHQDALRSALRIERSLLEKKCFNLFTPSGGTLQAVFSELNEESERHVKILLGEMKKNKFPL